MRRSNWWITNWQTNFNFWSQSCATPSTACSHSPSSFSYLMGQLIATAIVIYVICSALYDFKIVVDLLLFNSWHPQLYYWKILVNILKLPHAYSTYIVPLLYTLCALLEYYMFTYVQEFIIEKRVSNFHMPYQNEPIKYSEVKRLPINNPWLVWILPHAGPDWYGWMHHYMQVY